jgi:hypothetical protein
MRSNHKLFDSVLVVSDRNVLDAQLQEAIFDFERTKGVVATIKGEGGSKSGELAEALGGGKKIVVCTIQTFPFALKAVQELAATQGKRFAVIADEAHSSQTGEAASKLKQLLSAEELKDLATVARWAPKTCWRRRWQPGPTTPASPMWPSPPRPRPRRWSCLAAARSPSSPPGRATCPRPSTSTACARPSRRASSSMC